MRGLEKLLKVGLINANMTYSDHHILSVVIDPEITTAAEFVFETKQSMTSHEEIPRILKEMKAYKITVKQTLKQLKAVLEHTKDTRRWEWRMKEESNVCFAGKRCFPHIKRYHEKIIPVYPDLLETTLIFLLKLDLQLCNSLSESLVNLDIMSPELLEFCVSQVSQISLIECFEIVKQSLHHIFIEVVVR